MTSLPYTSLRGFENVYLEDSFVLGIDASPGAVDFDVDLVLTPGHPSYTPPPPDQQHCYRRGHIRFGQVRSLTWSCQGRVPAHDASGEIDYGAIDAFSAAASTFTLEGDWGRMEVESDAPVLELV
jgi:hypothetical protein